MARKKTNSSDCQYRLPHPQTGHVVTGPQLHCQHRLPPPPTGDVVTDPELPVIRAPSAYTGCPLMPASIASSDQGGAQLFDIPIILSTDLLRIQLTEPLSLPTSCGEMVSTPITYIAGHHNPFVRPSFASASTSVPLHLIPSTSTSTGAGVFLPSRKCTNADDSSSMVEFANMEQHNNPLGQLPTDVLVQHILLPHIHGKESEKAFFSIQNVDTVLKRICKSNQVQSEINLTRHLVFDCTKNIRYAHFILDCADKGNKHACLLFGLSMGFCFGQHDEAIKYLSKIRNDCPLAEYAYGILQITRFKPRYEGVLVLRNLINNGPEDYIHRTRINLLQMLNPGLHFNLSLKMLGFYCSRGPNCCKRSHNETATVDGKRIEVTCSDVNAAAIEYNVFRKAFVTRHEHTLKR